MLSCAPASSIARIPRCCCGIFLKGGPGHFRRTAIRLLRYVCSFSLGSAFLRHDPATYTYLLYCIRDGAAKQREEKSRRPLGEARTLCAAACSCTWLSTVTSMYVLLRSVSIRQKLLRMYAHIKVKKLSSGGVVFSAFLYIPFQSFQELHSSLLYQPVCSRHRTFKGPRRLLDTQSRACIHLEVRMHAYSSELCKSPGLEIGRNPQPSELAALRRTMVLSPPGQALCTYINIGVRNLSVPSLQCDLCTRPRLLCLLISDAVQAPEACIPKSGSLRQPCRSSPASVL